MLDDCKPGRETTDKHLGVGRISTWWSERETTPEWLYPLPSSNLLCSNVLMENPLFIEYVPIKTSIHRGFPLPLYRRGGGHFSFGHQAHLHRVERGSCFEVLISEGQYWRSVLFSIEQIKSYRNSILYLLIRSKGTTGYVSYILLRNILDLC